MGVGLELWGEEGIRPRFIEGCIPWWPATPDKEMAPEWGLFASEPHRALSGGRQAREMLPAPCAQNFLLGGLAHCPYCVWRQRVTSGADPETGSVIRPKFPLFCVCSACRCQCVHTCMWKPETTSGGVPHTPLPCFVASGGVPHLYLVSLRQGLSLAWVPWLGWLSPPLQLGLHLCAATFVFIGLRGRMQKSCFQDRHFLPSLF